MPNKWWDYSKPKGLEVTEKQMLRQLREAWEHCKSSKSPTWVVFHREKQDAIEEGQVEEGYLK